MRDPELTPRLGGRCLGVLVLVGCGVPPAGLRLLSRDPSRSEGSVYRVEWRSQVTSDHHMVAPLGWEMLRWASEETSGPTFVADPEEVVVGSTDGRVTAFSASGTRRWTFQTGGAITANLANQDGRIYVGSSDGSLTALDAATGRLVWSYDTGEELGSTPVASADAILVATRQDTVFCLEAATGRWRWHHRRSNSREFTIRGVATPRVVEGVAVAGYSGGTVVALRIQDGSVKWQHSLPAGEQFADADGDPQIEAGRVYVASYHGGIAALRLETGTMLWRHPLPEATNLLFHRGQLFVGSAGHMTSLASIDGHLLWEHATGDVSPHGLELVAGLLVVPTDGPLLFLDPGSGRLLGRGFNPGRGVTAAPAIGGRSLFALSNAGWLYGLKLQ
jgi:outer membrane protein assembly factor BamB